MPRTKKFGTKSKTQNEDIFFVLKENFDEDGNVFRKLVYTGSIKFKALEVTPITDRKALSVVVCYADDEKETPIYGVEMNGTDESRLNGLFTIDKEISLSETSGKFTPEQIKLWMKTKVGTEIPASKISPYGGKVFHKCNTSTGMTIDQALEFRT